MGACEGMCEGMCGGTCEWDVAIHTCDVADTTAYVAYPALPHPHLRPPRILAHDARGDIDRYARQKRGQEKKRATHTDLALKRDVLLTDAHTAPQLRVERSVKGPGLCVCVCGTRSATVS